MKTIRHLLLIISVCSYVLSSAQDHFEAIQFESVGPSVMSGRVVDLEVNPEDPTEFYVAYASGGLWHTTDNGTSFAPIFDNAPTQNLGEIAMHWPSRTLYVGTGENNSSRSSYAGIGLFKTINNGKDWTFLGLEDSHHIGRILVDPSNPDHVIVGVLGHLYTPNAERGIYRSTNGGNSWQQTLFINEDTGVIDLAHDPNNFNTIYAASWQRDRKAWNFEGSGPNSALYKSIDAGQTWQKISTEASGFPQGQGVGRIGLAVFNDQTIYAVVDNQARRSAEAKEETEGLVKDDFKRMSAEELLKLDNKALNDYLKTNGFQEKYRAENVKQLVRDGLVIPKDLATYLEDANAMLFDTPVIGAEVYRSDDAGKSWKRTHEEYIDALFYSYGYYFAQVRVDPNDSEVIYLAGVPLIQSKDGGKTFSSIDKRNVHADHHALWINPKRPGHLINGNDGGINISYDDGANWTKNNSPSVGQFYAIQVDNQSPYNVYGGLQDNGVWKAKHSSRESSEWLATGLNPWQELLGGDGMQVEVDPRGANVVYTGFQFGNYYRIDQKTGKRTYITPKHTLGEAPYRFNWQTPILLSKHHPDVLYMGSNKLHRSLDQGSNWHTLSEDLTQGGRKGNVAYGTLTSISESEFEFGLIYTGSDDGLIHLSKDGGHSFSRISDALPKDLWVSRVAASSHKKERVYATLNAYRNDDFAPYVFVSDDYGANWKNIAANLPQSSVNVIVEDPVNEDLLFAGLDNGLYVTLDRGASWSLLDKGLVPVAVHDLKIQKEAKHLVVGTHGRSIYITSIEALQQANKSLLSKPLHLFTPEKMRFSSRWGNARALFELPYTPKTSLSYYSATDQPVSLSVLLEGRELYRLSEQAYSGFNAIDYSVEIDQSLLEKLPKKSREAFKPAKNGSYYLPKGEYSLVLTGNKGQSTATFTVE
ncbi:MAG: glycosyl hydrolase [Flavobacteriaceae bacterium]